MNKMHQSTSYKIFTFFNTVFMLFIVAVTLFPFLYLISVSISDSTAVNAGKVSFYPIGFNIEGYRLVLSQKLFFINYLNTIKYTLFGTAFSLTATIMCAYALSKTHLKGRKPIMIVVIITMYVFPGLIPNYILITRLLGDSMWALILPSMINPFNMILMLTYFKGLPQSLEEAASLDGLNPIKILIYIVVPLSKPVIATIGLFYTVQYWNDWFAAMIYMNDTDKYPVMLYLRNLVEGMTISFTSGGVVIKSSDMEVVPEAMKSAAVMLVTVPILLVYPFIQKYFVQGAMMGSIKE